MPVGDIVLVDYPMVIDGHEQMGRRPAVVFQDDTIAGTSPLVLTAPFTTTNLQSRFPGVIAVSPSAINGLSTQS